MNTKKKKNTTNCIKLIISQIQEATCLNNSKTILRYENALNNHLFDKKKGNIKTQKYG